MIPRVERIPIANAARGGARVVLCLAAGLLVLACADAPTEAPPREPPAPETPATGADPPAEAPPEPVTVFDLRPGEPQERELAPGATHVYRVALAAGDFLHAVVDQRGVDVELVLVDAGGDEVARGLDRPFGPFGKEPLAALVDRDGDHRLEVRALPRERPARRYRLEVLAARPATREDRRRVDATRHFLEITPPSSTADHRATIPLYRQSLQRWRELGDPAWQAETLDRIGYSHYRLGSWREALEAYRGAATLFAEQGEAHAQAFELTEIGRVRAKLGDLAGAVVELERSLELRRELGDRRGQAGALANLADVSQLMGETQRALDLFDRALVIWREERRLEEIGTTLHNLGVLHAALGDRERALDYLSEAETTFREASSPRLAATLNQRGKLHRELGQPREALPLLRTALELRTGRNHLPGQAAALSELGQVHQALEQNELALESYRRALDLLQDLDHPRKRAKVLRYLGALYLDLDRPAEAAARLEEALAIYRRLEEPAGRVESLGALARATWRLNDLETARENFEQALDVVESLRVNMLAPSLRAAYFATAQPHFEGYVELLMELHDREGDAGHDARALEAVERARARSLLDLLTVSGTDLRRDLDPALRARETELLVAIDRRERQRQLLLQLLESQGEHTENGKLAAGRLAVEDAALRELLTRLEALRAEIRSSSPTYAAITQPRPADLGRIRELLVDPDSSGVEALLLVYRLGSARSFLWRVGPDSLESFELAPREEIERAAREVWERLAGSHDPRGARATENALCALAHQVLAPLGGRLDRERLLIVADGALEYVPFAALPDPDGLEPGGAGCGAASPLVEEHAITYLSSATTLDLLRRPRAAGAKARGIIAVVADPVFGLADERVATADDAVRSSEDDSGALARLPFSRQEAESILALVPEPSARYCALGFDATRELIQSGRLAGYRYVHLATHGRLDATHPELSALVFSGVDEQGRPREDPVLSLHEIYGLELDAELVTLSACQTALGKELRGEGIWGLTRGFLHAGAARVMVSLWRVGDRGTAELMSRFYRELLQNDLEPAAALRAAQRALRREPEWRAPYHWAAFVVQGEWLSPR